MKSYEWIELGESKVLQSTDESGKNWQIPTDPANSQYAEYLRYTAWVDEGNDPDEFWTVELTQEI